MVTTAANLDSRYRSYPGEGYDGVVRVSIGGYYATGSLLYDGRALLTAAHLFEGRSGSAKVTFETVNGTQSVSTIKTLVHPDYDIADSNNDLALVWLPGTAPTTANRYNLYRDSDEIGQSFTMVGYGKTGTGSTGVIEDDTSTPMRHKANNQFDADASTLKSYLGAGISWTPLAGTQLMADFDDGTSLHDALGQLIYRSDTGLGLDEGFIAPGDSGGPAFIGNRLAGVASYTASLSKGSIEPDVDDLLNSSFGEVAAWQRVSFYQQWIDQNLRANYADAPTKPEDVKKAITEGDSDTRYAYFLLQFTGVRSDPNQILSVDYASRDGTAQVGYDYIAVSGRLNLYPNENQAVIPVEIIGDTMAEPNENFYLDVFNPVGGSFGEGVIKLTAARTIIDDDGWVA